MLYKNYYGRSPWRDLEQFQKEMNRLFNNAASNRTRSAAGFPAMNIWANEDSAIVTAELPGVNAADIEIAIAGETMTLKGNRKPDDMPEDACCHRQERGYGEFIRTIQLPFLVNAEKVEAVFNKGILQITLPRAEADKPKKIIVKAV